MINKVDIKVNYNTQPERPYPSEEDLENGPNVERIDAALAAIDASPANWDQAHWAVRTLDVEEEELPEVVVKPVPSCGTALCLAGHVVSQAGYFILFEEDEDESVLAVDSYGQRYFIPDLAETLLNLTGKQARSLFAYQNGRVDLQYIRDDIVDGRNA